MKDDATPTSRYESQCSWFSEVVDGSRDPGCASDLESIRYVDSENAPGSRE